ncbi:hypothetical protein ECA3089 [Pectobacterium atrosepticum SCRI1043]|uniref:Uncharacterized protein n=2 Tax=Pectobacterium atrosepticum TaxID=29471 RepID=Q6D2K6_PECAS|nr:hypothetical protein ECA3089 [Pectobacterium atrosepticum SCRI1043]
MPHAMYVLYKCGGTRYTVFLIFALLRSAMPSIKLTVNYLYRQSGETREASQATARVFAGDDLVATEVITGMTESPVDKYLHYSGPENQPVRVEWYCQGTTVMTVSAVEICPCCHHD